MAYCSKCGKALVKVMGKWTHPTHEDFQNCGFAAVTKKPLSREATAGPFWDPKDQM